MKISTAPRVLIVALTLVAASMSSAQYATVTPPEGWTVFVTSGDVQDASGTPLFPTYQSDESGLDVTLTVSGRGNSPWCIAVSRSAWLPAAALTLSVRSERLSGEVTDSTDWVEVTTVEQNLVAGRGDAVMSLEYRLAGVDLSLAPQQAGYSTNVSYAQIQGCS